MIDDTIRNFTKLSVAILVSATAVMADEITLLRPLDEVRSLHTPAQREFFSLPRARRRANFIDQNIRIQWKKIGSQPASVELVWRSDLPADAVLTLILTCDGMEKRFSVSGDRFAAVNLLPGKNYSWQVVGILSNGMKVFSPVGKFQTAGELPRLLNFFNVGNVRDLGGYIASDGKKVRFDRIYRGRALNNNSPDQNTTPGALRVTSREIAKIQEFKIKTDLELRSNGQTAGMTETPFGGDTRWERTGGLVSYGYILTPAHKRRFATTIRTFLVENNYPIYVHCDGGRDRTGTLCFLVLGALGVGDADLELDWQTSALYFSDLPQKYFDDFIEALRTVYGKGSYAELAQCYLLDIGFSINDIRKLRELLLTE